MVRRFIFINKVYVILTKWCYPFGGGEEFMFQSMKWAHELGMKSYWICYNDANNNNFDKLAIDEHKYGKILKIPGGLNKESVYNWLKLLNPDFVHHQGHLRDLFFSVTKKLRIEFLTGFHFWSGGIILDTQHKNINILKNHKHHKPDPQIIKLWDEPLCNFYTVTDFVSKCIYKITNKKIDDHIIAASDYKKIKIKNFSPWKNKFVTVINIHKLKGGEIILRIIKKLKNVPFLVVRTEYGSEKLDNQIKYEINKRTDGSKFMERVSDPTIIYKQTKILLAPSLVDETFCRTVNEAMLNGIPVITTGQGNIKYLVGNAGIIIKPGNYNRWINNIYKLYHTKNLYNKYNIRILRQYKANSEQKAKQQFKKISEKIILKSKERNVMIFTPWCDQGLGIQSRNYAKILLKEGFNVCIFSIKPYNADTSLDMQKNPEEWVIDNIYYSPYDREHITDSEIIRFVEKYNIGKCIIPETCWFRIFEIAKLLRKLNVKTYAVPNIEIVRKDEMFKHNYFYMIMCNNYLCYNIFKNNEITNIEYIGYGIDKDDILFKPTKKAKKINFLFIGGMNAFLRKHILDVCEAFDIASKKYKNINLTCTIQKTNLLETADKKCIKKYFKNNKITFIQDHLPYSQIIQLYYDHHISIQVSKQEGLGLGFYEAITTGTPIISLDTAPHNEIVKNNINGWLVDCHYKKMTDNTDSLLESAYFDPKLLAKKIEHVANLSPYKYKSIITTMKKDYHKRLHVDKFKQRFIKCLS